jgi:hypothetical protein
MHRTTQTMRSVLLGVAAVAIFVAALQGQSILGPPNEANHFIETPPGWVHPRTPWGEPDITATDRKSPHAEPALPPHSLRKFSTRKTDEVRGNTGL